MDIEPENGRVLEMLAQESLDHHDHKAAKASMNDPRRRMSAQIHQSTLPIFDDGKVVRNHSWLRRPFRRSPASQHG
ncbi:hypothetical protein V6N13_137912 [Hibiscus sabdariffa]